jgi:hypothetical protein
VENDVALSFQAPFDVKLFRPLVRRLMRPFMAGVCAIGLVIALLVELAGERELAVEIAAGCVGTAVLLPWYFASEVAKREAPRFGHPIAYRIDRTGVQILGGFNTTTLTWSQITRVEQRRNQVALYFGRRSVQSIPTGTLTAEQRAQLKDLLRSRDSNRQAAG